jgi:hypothetical protein
MLLLPSQEGQVMKSDYFRGLFKHGATGATGATESKKPNNNADLALPNGVAPNKNEGATGATKPISAHQPVALVAQTKKEGATGGASLEARTGAASSEVLPVLPQKLSDIRTTHIDLSESRREIAGDGSEQTAPCRPLASDLEAPQGGAAVTPTSPIKHTRRRALASAPPPHPGPLTDGQQGPLSFLYSVLRDGRVERGSERASGPSQRPLSS